MLGWNAGNAIQEGGSRAPCLFCFKPCSKPPTSNLNGEIPGAVRSSKLEYQLHHLFIVRHLLEIPSSWCEQALERNDGRSHPDSWFRTCSECTKLVREGWCIYQKLLRFELEMKSIRARVRDVILESIQQDRASKSGMGMYNEIRGFVLKDVEMLVCQPPNFKEEEGESEAPEKYVFLHEEIDDIPGESPEEESPLSQDDDFTVESPEESPSESSEIDSDDDFVPVRSIRKRGGRGRPGRPKGSKTGPSLPHERRKRRKESNWKQCTLCSSKFIMQKYLDYHMEAHEKSKENGGKFDCEICSFPGSSEENLMNHIASKHNNPQKMFSKKYSCSQCDFTTEVPANLKDHMQQEHSVFPEEEEQEKSAVPTCSKCQRTFVTFRSLCLHERKMHPELFGVEETSIPCDKCDLLFSSKLRLQYHINNTHLRINKFICDICGKSVINMNTLNRHKVTHKKGESRQYVCDICGLDYSYKESLTSHYRKCHPTSTNNEDSSGAQPGLKTNEEIHKCRYCGMEFPFKAVLLKHLHTHKASMGHQCDICKKYYSTDQGLKRHKSINHSGTSEQFNCKFCFKVFTSMNSVQDHTRNFCRIKRLVDKPPIPNTAVVESGPNVAQSSSSAAT